MGRSYKLIHGAMEICCIDVRISLRCVCGKNILYLKFLFLKCRKKDPMSN